MGSNEEVTSKVTKEGFQDKGSLEGEDSKSSGLDAER